MAMNDSLSNCQAYAVPFKLIATVETLKDAEQLIGILHVEPRAVVLDEVYRYGIVLLAIHLDDGGISLPGVFQRIRK